MLPISLAFSAFDSLESTWKSYMTSISLHISEHILILRSKRSTLMTEIVQRGIIHFINTQQWGTIYDSALNSLQALDGIYYTLLQTSELDFQDLFRPTVIVFVYSSLRVRATFGSFSGHLVV